MDFPRTLFGQKQPSETQSSNQPSQSAEGVAKSVGQKPLAAVTKMRAHRFLALAVTNLIVSFTMLGIIQALAQTPRATTSTTQAPALFSDTFDGNTLDPSKWYTETGTPIVGGGWLTLTAAEIRSIPSFSSGILRGVIQSSDWTSQSQFTDSSFGFEIWAGNNGQCHYAILFKASGHLAMLRSQPDTNGNCSGDPLYQAYPTVSNWDTIRAGNTVSFTLSWCSDVVTLTLSGNGQEGQAAYTGQAMPNVPLKIRLYAQPPETYTIDYIQLYACHVVYLPMVIRQLPPITQNLSISALAYSFQNSGITVTAGDQLEFSASGNWNCGSGGTGPNGNAGITDSNTPVPSANLCALVGVIGVDTPSAGSGFFIGSSNQITATQSGTLYLGSNDNLGKCDGINLGSCYYDNQGTISVWILVRQH